MTNFNFSALPGYPGYEMTVLKYKDASGVTCDITDVIGMQTMLRAFTTSHIAYNYAKRPYPAKSLVCHNGLLYYNPNAIETAEDWNGDHWYEITLAGYILLMTT